jgi:hypothetical protein
MFHQFYVPSLAFILAAGTLSADVMPFEEQNEEGVTVERNLDGTETITAPDGTRFKIMPSGEKVPQLRDTVVQENPDGTDTITSPDENVEIEKD